MAALAPTQAPGTQEYAGDEISALVLDPGSHTTRAGFAGEDTPKSVVPTSYALTGAGEKVFGENAIHLPKPDVEIRNPFGADGVVDDWETAARLWEYSITSRLTGARQRPPSTEEGLAAGRRDAHGDVDMDAAAEQADDREPVLGEYPLLMSEPAWNPAQAREKTIELAMEQWGVPAFFLARNGQLAAYSQGKATALVVDVGHLHTSVAAMYEGMVLRKSVHRSPLAGRWLSDQIRLMFARAQPPVPLVPHYLVKAKSPVDAGAPSNATYAALAAPPTASFRRLEEERVLTAFKESVVQAWPGPQRLEAPAAPGGFSNMDHVAQLPPRPFEMPDGWNTVFGAERFKVAEGLFDHNAAYADAAHPRPSPDDTVTRMVHRALEACDIDQRPAYMNNIVVTGAASLVDKLPDRLQSDLAAIYPNPKVRVIAASNTVERKYAAWIGGSVLASLGTFHQMWISRQEYEEFGAKIVEKRCK